MTDCYNSLELQTIINSFPPKLFLLPYFCLNKVLLIFIILNYMCGYVHISSGVQRPRMLNGPGAGAGVTAVCEPPDMGTRN